MDDLALRVAVITPPAKAKTVHRHFMRATNLYTSAAYELVQFIEYSDVKYIYAATKYITEGTAEIDLTTKAMNALNN